EPGGVQEGAIHPGLLPGEAARRVIGVDQHYQKDSETAQAIEGGEMAMRFGRERGNGQLSHKRPPAGTRASPPTQRQVLITCFAPTGQGGLAASARSVRRHVAVWFGEVCVLEVTRDGSLARGLPPHRLNPGCGRPRTAPPWQNDPGGPTSLR